MMTSLHVVLFVVLASMYFILKIQRVKESELTSMVQETGAAHFLPVLLQSGSWSPEIFVSTPVPQLPSALTKDQRNRAAAQDLKRWVREKLMLQRWITEQGLEDFRMVMTKTSLKQWGYRVPSIHRMQQEHEMDVALDTALRHTLRSEYEKFEHAIKEFKSRSTFVLNRIPDYEADIIHRSKHHLPDNVWCFLMQQDLGEIVKDVLITTVYGLVGCVVVEMSVRQGPLWAMVAYWIHPPTGRLCIYGAILLKASGVFSLIALVLAELWMLATAVYMSSSLFGTVLISIAPTFFIFLMLEVLRFHPVLSIEQDGKIFLTITGIGNIDRNLKAFIQRPKQSGISWLFFGSDLWKHVDLSQLAGVAFEDVDADGELIMQLLQPSMKNNHLEYLAITNNHSLTDNSLRLLGDACRENSSLQILRITYHEMLSPAQKIASWVYQDKQGRKPTANAANYILEQFLEQPAKHQITAIDFSGLNLSEESVGVANQLRNKVPGIKIQGERREEGLAEGGKRWGLVCWGLVAMWCLFSFWVQIRQPHKIFMHL
jgi:hypothetical protein